MAQNFNEMTKEELEAVLNSDSIVKMNTVELNNLRKAVKAAGLLSVQYDNMLGIAINNTTYAEIKNSDKYTEEEKALALEARNEYNRELRARTKNKLYNAEEIMSRAVENNGQYHFDELTKGEMDFLLANGIVRMNELNVGKQYNLGQQKDRDFSKEISNNTTNLSDDVKKSQEFWNNFNNGNNGVKYVVQPLKDNSLKVDAQKDNKTVFTGIDHGNKGFDVVKKENNTEAYAIYDLIIKKAKTSNPKAKIRIKDNVKDPVLRNKILIACAKNNMEPIGNLPEGFDFAALKDMVKDVKDIATINALAENLYTMSGIEVANENPEKEDRAAAVILPQASQEAAPANKQEDKKGKTVVAPIPVVLGGKNNTQGIANTKGNNGGNIPPVQNQGTEKKVVEAPKRPWWKKVRDAAVVAGIALLGMIGVRSCQNQEKLEKNIKDLQEQVDKKSMTDCDEVSRLINEKYNDGYMDGLAQGLKDCEEQNKPQPKPVVKKKTPVKKTPVKKTPVKPVEKQPVIVPKVVKTVNVPKFGPVQEDHRLQPIPEANPYENLPNAPTRTVDTPKSSVPLEAVDTSMGHEKDNDLMNAVELDNKGKVTADNNKKAKTLDLSDPAVFNSVRNSINGNIH